MNNLFLEKNQVKFGLMADLNAQNAATRTTSRVLVDKGQRVVCIVSNASAAAAFSISFQQHTVASAGTPANLEVKLPYFKKLGAATYYTKVAAPSVDAHTVTDADASGGVSYYVFEFDADSITDTYKYISATIADPEAARLSSVEFIVAGDVLAPMYDKVI